VTRNGFGFGVGVFALLVMIIMAGCSGLQVSSATGHEMDLAAASAKSGLAATQPAAMGTLLADNAGVLRDLHEQATVNGFQYLFGVKKVWANAAIFSTIAQEDAVACELASRAAAGGLYQTNLAMALQVEAKYLEQLQLQRAGTAPTNSLVSLAKIRTAAANPPTKVAAGQPTAAQAKASLDLGNLIASLPDQFKPWAQQYGPALLRLGVAEADAEIALLISGDTDTPYRAALSAMTQDELMAEASENLTKSIAVTNANAASVSFQKQAAEGLLTLGVSVAMALLGF